MDALESGSVLLTAGAGYGKTTILDEALNGQSGPVAWVSCSSTERVPETLLQRILEATARAVPGASDALSERLAAATGQVDELGAAHELLAELPRLLVEPLTLVVDDGEQLDGAERSLLLLSELIRAELDSFRVAVASRRPLELRVGKPRATGRLVELAPADLAFDSEECAALLSARSGREPTAAEVEEVMEATQGWPLGIGLAAAMLDGTGTGVGESLELGELRSAPDLRSFFSEELLDSLEPELREAAIESSVVRVVGPEVAGALDLPEDFDRSLERAGMLITRTGDDGKFAYHPLLREFLLERLEAERGEEERRRLHAAVAPAVAAAGDPIDAIEHWLAAESWPEAIEAIEQQGPGLTRTSSGLLRRWISQLPPDARALPTVKSLEGQLEWGAGDHPRAAEILREAVQGFRERPNPPAEWLTRFVLGDSLFAIGEFDELAELVEGWDEPEAEAAGVLAAATAFYISIAFATVGKIEESDRLAARARKHPNADLFGPAEALRLAFRDTPPGHLDRVLAEVEGAVEELERFDPFNRRLYLVAVLAQMYAERGRTDESLRTWQRVREGAGGGSGPFLVDTTHAWRALLLTQQGRLKEAEAELAQFEGREQTWRTCVGPLAEAGIASLRGDAAEAVAAGDRALAMVASAPVVYVHRTAAQLIPDLVTVGRADRALEILDETSELVDRTYPGELGIFLRGRLIALRAWIRHTEGDAEGADEDLRSFWKESGETLPHTLRREWVRLREPLWDALERGALEPEPTVRAISQAFPEGLPLVGFLEHPIAAVRREALEPATESGDPAALDQLRLLADDPDPELAGAAARGAERLARTLPPLRFEVLGDFAVGRGSWRAEAWGRPVDARLVRFLLVALDQPVPEDIIFEALWPKLSVDKARQSLQVAASRARRVLDPPGAERSVIESFDRSYRLVLGDRDSVDAEEFRAAAEAALGDRGEQRGHRLQHARSLWGGEPLREDRYSDWAAAYRERLLDTYAAVLAGLVEIHERAGEHPQAVDVAREMVDFDPLNEGGHRALIAAYARAGRTGHALRQYLECRRALVDGLGIEPSQATSDLQARVLAGEPV